MSAARRHPGFQAIHIESIGWANACMAYLTHYLFKCPGKTKGKGFKNALVGTTVLPNKHTHIYIYVYVYVCICIGMCICICIRICI